MNDELINTPEWLVTVGFCIPSSGVSWPFGTDGALSINGTVTTLLAGSIKDYSSISIINGGELQIINSLGTGNGGNVPTIIGCKGNATINTGGKITANQNALPANTSAPTAYFYSENSPSGAAVTPITYTTNLRSGGEGGASGGGMGGGASIAYGHGGGGGGNAAGGEPVDDSLWGISGRGGADSSAVSANPITAFPSSFSTNGNDGSGVTDPAATGGGGSGGTRGLAGGCFYLQVAGTLTVSGVVFEAKGAAGGAGGNGGDSSAGFGAGGGAGAPGGDGGKIYIRYKAGTASAANCDVTGGTGGGQGAGGTGTIMSGNSSTPVDNSVNGTTSIASY